LSGANHSGRPQNTKAVTGALRPEAPWRHDFLSCGGKKETELSFRTSEIPIYSRVVAKAFALISTTASTAHGQVIAPEATSAFEGPVTVATLAFTVILVTGLFFGLLFLRQLKRQLLQTKADLKTSEKRFEEFIEIVADRYWELDENLNVILLKSVATGRDAPGAKEVIGRPFLARFDPTESESDLEDIERKLDARETLRNYLYHRKNSSGEHEYVHVSAVPIFDEQNVFAGYRGISFEVEPEEDTARRVKEADDKFAAAIDASSEGINFWDSEGRFVRSNTTFNKLRPHVVPLLQPGISYAEFIRARIKVLPAIHDPGKDPEVWAEEHIAEFMAGTFQRQIKAGDRWLSTRSEKLPDNSTIVFRRDITAEKNRADELRQTQKMEAIGQLTSGIAHDFNNMLAGFMGNIDLIRMEIPEENTYLHERLDHAAATVQRGAALTQHLLAFSRKQILQPEPTNIATLIRNISDMLKRTLGEQVTVVTEFGNPDWVVLTDANQLENALLNLAINSRDAMPDGGTLTISTDNVGNPDQVTGLADKESGQAWIAIKVADNGKGIPPDVMDKIFEPFFTTKEFGKGSGLGLSMVHGFAHQSGGHIDVESVVDVGTCFTIYLLQVDAATAP
jgi:signal transduction histidine kinase